MSSSSSSPLNNVNFVSHILRFVCPFRIEHNHDFDELTVGKFFNLEMPQHFRLAYVCSSFREAIVDFCCAVKPIFDQGLIRTKMLKPQKYSQERNPTLPTMLYKIADKALKLNVPWMVETLARAGIRMFCNSEPHLRILQKIQAAHPSHPVVLNLSFCGDFVTDARLEEILDSFPHLQEIHLSFCSKLTGAGHELLGRLNSGSASSSIQVIEIFDGYIPTKNFRFLQLFENCPSLKSLLLARCYGIEDDSFIHLSKIPQLQELDVTKCSKVTDQGLMQLVNHPSLNPEMITWAETKITQQGFDEFKELLLANQKKK
jgi:hypothetical protein